ncbi:MAG: methylated-DNA--[protein]-cysteine S-methyltransferase [Oscillospiraceae bacterium]|nr:methylated-DNA--[protein]-cysteine S-methyltransferase [Oscillospiraceae bacterium]
MKKVWYFKTQIGTIAIGCDERGITDVAPARVDGIKEKTPLIERAASEIDEYLRGERREFDLPLSVSGTEFQKAVWRELQKIPYGETRSYGDIAKAVGNPKAQRAVGTANNRNKIMIIIPCHRVIGANGHLTGYAGGLDMKKRLLDIEKAGCKAGSEK